MYREKLEQKAKYEFAKMRANLVIIISITEEEKEVTRKSSPDRYQVCYFDETRERERLRENQFKTCYKYNYSLSFNQT